jgi:hypothetical protein
MIWFFVSFFAWVRVSFYRNSFTTSFVVVLVVLTAFRYYVGADYWAYVHLFNDSVLGKDVPVELSYFLISAALAEMGFNFQAIIFLYAIFTYLFIYKGLKEINQTEKGKYLAYYSRNNYVPLIRAEYFNQCNFYDDVHSRAKEKIGKECTEKRQMAEFCYGETVMHKPFLMV